jgi:hypothetical protein
MRRFFVLLLLPAIFFCTCGGDSKCPWGSECTLIDCSCTSVVCQYISTTQDIKIVYDNSGKNTATLVIATKGIDPVEGHVYTSDEITKGLVTLYRVESNWTNTLDKSQSHCKIDTYGGAGGKLEGSCLFVFKHQTGDFNANIPFNCTLEALNI